ncbi:MAG: N(G),N(G)-dimethylarginine dimethylaminohydrolase [Acidobacteria bacterium]|nr:N(G),N(G)-dimethylarginine dimethylaminohydrolase [Acidobacteriota bacterium]
MFEKAIVRKPSERYTEGITTSTLGVPNLEKALAQHNQYIDALKKCGVKVTVLEGNNQFPDSTFVEDEAVIVGKLVVVTRPGNPSRAGEAALITPVLENFFERMEQITSPGTLDGGDVMEVGSTFFIGLSERTNGEGAKQLKSIVEREGYHAFMIPVGTGLHLKTFMGVVGENDIVVLDRFQDRPEISGLNRLVVSPENTYACNCRRVNNNVILPAGFPAVSTMLTENGFSILEVELSEFQKMDGGISCLSLLF